MDNINNPNHYTAGGLEVIEILKAKLGKEEYEGYLKGNCFKYLFRYKAKNGLEDLKKCAKYLEWLIELNNK